MNHYQRVLFLILSGIVLFEGFDVTLAQITLPYVAHDFAVDVGQAGRALALAASGAIGAFFTIRLADRYGRRPVLIAAVAGFAGFSLATAFSTTLYQFAVLQFCARVMLVTQVTIAYIFVSESLPPERRGRTSGIMMAFAGLGASSPTLLLPTFVESALGWRGMFAVGGLPLLTVPVLWFFLRESEAFLVARTQAQSASRGLLAQIRMAFSKPFRRRFIGVSALWLCINFGGATIMSFFTWYVLRERGWTPADLRVLAPFGLAMSFLGGILAGQAMDRLGRRRTAILYLMATTALAVTCYRAHNHVLIGTCYVVMQALQGIWVVAYVYTTELFPTDFRAAASGLANNLIGRWGQVLATASVGSLAALLGSTSAAVIPMSFVALLCIPALIWALPETANDQTIASPTA